MNRQMYPAYRCALAGMLSAILVYSCSIASNAAEVYRWVDENGKVHYTDQPRDDAEAVAVEPPPKQPDSEAVAERLEKNAEWFGAQRRQREIEEKQQARERAKRAAVEAKAAERCKRYRDRLSNTEAELAARKRAGIRPSEENRFEIHIQKLRRQVEQNC